MFSGEKPRAGVAYATHLLVHLASISLSSHTTRYLKIVFTASLSNVRHKMDDVEKKPESSLVGSLSMTLGVIFSSFCGRQVVTRRRLPADNRN